MPRLALGVEYDGTGFRGWQYQGPGQTGPTVQAAVEKALSGVAGQPVSLICAGRTDAGVHATGQVAHFDSEVRRAPHNWLLGANALLPGAVRLNWVRPVAADFHARFSAVQRQYRYVLCCGRERPALLRDRVGWAWQELDTAAMARAASCLPGRHDFSAFRAAGCQARHAVRTIHLLRVWQRGRYRVIDVRADGFLHHMVRNIVGSLIQVGRGAHPAGWLEQVLAGRDRRCAGPTAPASGLYLTGVLYPDRFPLPATPPPPVYWA